MNKAATFFYEPAGGKLVWSGRSRILEGAEVDAYLPIYSKTLLKELKIEKVIE